MHVVSAAFQSAIAQGTVRMAELYDVALANGTTYRYTNHGGNITWNAAGDIYTAIPIERRPISGHTDGSFDTVELMVGMIEGELRDKIKKNILEAAEITIRLISWDASYAADEQIIMFVGQPDVRFNARALNIHLTSEIDSLNIVVPRDIYQPCCNRYLFDAHCGLIRSSYAYSGTATGGSATTLIDTNAGIVYKVDFDAGDSGNPIARSETITGGDNGYTAKIIQIVYLTATTGTIWYVELSNANNFNDNEVLSGGGDSLTVNGTPAADTTFYEIGEIEMLTGDNEGECRPILSDSGSTRMVLWPFVSAIANGDTYKIYPGCDGLAATCKNKFDNKMKWRGFAYVPLTEEITF